jgi:anthranilate phosphoribosyltransferase
MAPVMAAVLAARGDTALVFRGDDGLDELTTTTTSSVWIATAGTVTETSIDPARLGIEAVPPEALRGADRVHNAVVVRDLLAGGGRSGVRNVVLLNAAAAIAAHDGLDHDDVDAALRRGLDLGVRAIDTGAAADVLDRWVEYGRRVRPR